MTERERQRRARQSAANINRTRECLHHRKGRPKNRMAIPMPRRRMDAGLLAGNPRFHGVRGAWTSTVRRSRSGARDHQNPICRLLVRGGGAPDCAVKRNVAASATLDGVRNVPTRFRAACPDRTSIARSDQSALPLKADIVLQQDRDVSFVPISSQIGRAHV